MSKLPDGPSDRFFGASLISRFRRDPLSFVVEVARAYPEIAHFRLGPYRAFLVNQPALIHDALVTHAKSVRKGARQLRTLGQVDGEGLVISEGELWRRQRRLVVSAFRPARLANYARVAAELAERQAMRWKAGEELEIASEMTRLTVEIIAKTMFDVEIGSEVDQIAASMKTLSEVFFHEFGAVFTLPNWVPLPSIRRKVAAMQFMDSMIRRMIHERRASGEDRGDFLSTLLLAVDTEGDGKGMSDELARDEAMTMFNGGHDTTAAALAWAWYYIGQHPEIEQRIVGEVASVAGTRPLTLEDAPKLVVLEQVVKETLRLRPPAALLFTREALEDFPLGDYTIPRDSWLFFSPFATHRDERYFPNAEMFDPDRFQSGRVEKIPSHAFFPFGAGPHICVGSTLAMLEMKLALATILRRWHLNLQPGQAIEPEVLVALRPKPGIRMVVAERN